MTRTLSLTIVVAALAFAGCKKKDEAGKPADPAAKPADPADKPADPAAKPAEPAAKPAEPAPAAKLAALDLSVVGEDWKGWTVMAPEGATVKESFGSANITLGEGFQYDLRLDKADVAAYKKEQESNDINKLKGYVVDQPDAILYESEVMGRTEFHFYASVKSGDVEFTCEDVKGPLHSKADAEAMLASCRTVAKK